MAEGQSLEIGLAGIRHCGIFRQVLCVLPPAATSRRGRPTFRQSSHAAQSLSSLVPSVGSSHIYFKSPCCALKSPSKMSSAPNPDRASFDKSGQYLWKVASGHERRRCTAAAAFSVKPKLNGLSALVFFAFGIGQLEDAGISRWARRDACTVTTIPLEPTMPKKPSENSFSSTRTAASSSIAKIRSW